MASSQADYPYEDLEKYLDMSELSLHNFEERYPHLGFEYINPTTVAINILNRFTSDVNDTHIKEISYLDLEEQDTITIGSKVMYDKDISVLDF